MELRIFNRRRSLKSAAGAVAVVRGGEGECAGFVAVMVWVLYVRSMIGEIRGVGGGLSSFGGY